ncbi:MAG TPA: TetR/AcrR family transcriptional regulator [Spirochaetota bacterium]|nr:TetR/AcrR family transcriptional regulator [Spirochaetota bacterium]HPJ36469.1 TetR/AcrR family transcriptional regulator [Spirochaetota bacterium]
MNKTRDVPVKTRDRILLTALKLFNEHTASAISTNHISAEMNISPGNLYYYFKNKEEIIRDIYKKLSELADAIWYHPELGQSEEGLVDYFRNLASHMYEFRFFYLELNVILKNDPVLKNEYIDRSDRILLQMMVIFSNFIQKKIMKNFDSEREKKYLMRNIWTVGQMWMTYSNIKYDSVTSEIVNDGVWQMYTVVEHLFTKRARAKIENMLFEIFPV